MRRLCLALAFLLIGSVANAQNLIPADGAICLPAEYTDGQLIRATACYPWFSYPSSSPGKGETTGQSKKTEPEQKTKADRLVPARPASAEAAP
jgi:hypothetical protein